MVNLNDFKAFCGFPVEGMKSIGLLVITKAPGHESEAFSFPSGSLFRSGDLGFVSSEEFNLTQSSRMIEIAVTAQNMGETGNIEAGRVWISPVTNTVANNPVPFSGGVNEQKTTGQLTDKLNVPPDSVIQSQLDIATDQILKRLADATPLDVPAVDRATYLLGHYYLENRSTQHKQSSLNIDAITETKTQVYRQALWEAINREIDNLLAPFRNPTAFMPDVPT